MITLNQPFGYGLVLRLKEFGYGLTSTAAGLTGKPAGNDAAIQAIVDAYTLQDAKDYLVSLVDAQAKSVRDAAMSAHSPFESALWTVKENEATAWTADNNASTPELTREATARSMAVATLAAKVLEKATAYHAFDAAVWTRRQALEDSIQACTTFDQVNAIEASIETGWI